MNQMSAALVFLACLLPPGPQDPDEVPVTIKELDVEGAIREFTEFQRRLGEFREQIGEGQVIAKEAAQILEELRSTASPGLEQAASA